MFSRLGARQKTFDGMKNCAHDEYGTWKKSVFELREKKRWTSGGEAFYSESREQKGTQGGNKDEEIKRVYA